MCPKERLETGIVKCSIYKYIYYSYFVKVKNSTNSPKCITEPITCNTPGTNNDTNSSIIDNQQLNKTFQGCGIDMEGLNTFNIIDLDGSDVGYFVSHDNELSEKEDVNGSINIHEDVICANGKLTEKVNDSDDECNTIVDKLNVSDDECNKIPGKEGDHTTSASRITANIPKPNPVTLVPIDGLPTINTHTVSSGIGVCGTTTIEKHAKKLCEIFNTYNYAT